MKPGSSERDKRKPVPGFNVDVVPDDWFPVPPHGAVGDQWGVDEQGRPVLVRDRRMLATQSFVERLARDGDG
jgi:hypothetical protein